MKRKRRIFLKLYVKDNDKKPFAVIEIDDEEIHTKLVNILNGVDEDKENNNLTYITIGDFTFKKENLNYIVKEYK